MLSNMAYIRALYSDDFFTLSLRTTHQSSLHSHTPDFRNEEHTKGKTTIKQTGTNDMNANYLKMHQKLSGEVDGYMKIGW